MLFNYRFYPKRYNTLRKPNFLIRQLSMLEETKDLSSYVREIFDDSKQRNIFSLNVTGGGISSLKMLFTVPGASKSLKYVTIPYSRSSLLKTVSREEENINIQSYCSSDIALRLAEESFRTTVDNILLEEPNILVDQSKIRIFGVGCTAALATSVPKRGDHRCHIALVSGKTVIKSSIILDKEILTREEEDLICSEVIIDLIGKFCGLKPLLTEQSPRKKFYSINTETIDNLRLAAVQEFLEKKDNLFCFPSLHNSSPLEWLTLSNCSLPARSLIFPGSFNPLHDGHLNLVETALTELSLTKHNCLVIFEIAAINVDKPPLSEEEILRRVAQFFYSRNSLLMKLLQENKVVIGIAITSSPRFIEKCKIFPNCNFVVGADTLERLLDLKYYKASVDTTQVSEELYSVAKIVQSIGILASSGCKFIVGGRLEQKKPINGDNRDSTPQFQTISSIASANPTANLINNLFPDLFQQIDERKFRADISSTEIRKKAENAQSQK